MADDDVKEKEKITLVLTALKAGWVGMRSMPCAADVHATVRWIQSSFDAAFANRVISNTIERVEILGSARRNTSCTSGHKTTAPPSP
jgi:hypothetical protein